MTVLVAYGSIEGQTEKIARHIAKTLRTMGKQAVECNTQDSDAEIAKDCEAAILCAPIHVGKYPKRFRKFVKANKEMIDGMPNAFVSVSLAINSEHEDEVREAREYVEKFSSKSGWVPGAVHRADCSSRRAAIERPLPGAVRGKFRTQE